MLPVVSNWKSGRDYTVLLDYRIAAQGEKEAKTLSDGLAAFAKALCKAERQARVNVGKRASLQRAVSLRQKEERANELRNLAFKPVRFVVLTHLVMPLSWSAISNRWASRACV